MFAMKAYVTRRRIIRHFHVDPHVGYHHSYRHSMKPLSFNEFQIIPVILRNFIELIFVIAH